MKKRKLILGLSIAAILVCGLGGFILLGDSGTSELPESLAQLNPKMGRPTVSSETGSDSFYRTYTFSQSLVEVHGLLRRECVDKRGWIDVKLKPPYIFQNPYDQDEMYILKNLSFIGQNQLGTPQLLHMRKATTFERYKKKFMVWIGQDREKTMIISAP